MEIHVGILTASDRSARGERADQTGPALLKAVEERGWKAVRQEILPDDRKAIAACIIEWAKTGKVDVMLIAGGTGFGPRDVTPEATRDAIEREAPGLAEAMRSESLKSTPHAMLSRGVAGIRKRMLVINLPGSPKGAIENLEVILPALEHAAILLRGEEAGH